MEGRSDPLRAWPERPRIYHRHPSSRTSAASGPAGRRSRTWHGSEQDDAAPSWPSASPESREDVSPRRRECRVESGRAIANRLPIAPCVGEQEDHAVHHSIALLELNPPTNGLCVDETHLSFDPVTPSGAGCDAIPGPLIARLWKGHLGLPPDRLVQTTNEPSEECRMRCIPQWKWTGIEAQGRVQADDDGQPTELVDRQPRSHPALHATDLGTRHTRRLPDLGLAEPETQPPIADLRPDLAPEPIADPGSSVEASFVGTHPRSLRRGPWPAIIRAFSRGEHSGLPPAGAARFARPTSSPASGGHCSGLFARPTSNCGSRRLGAARVARPTSIRGSLGHRSGRFARGTSTAASGGRVRRAI